MLAHQELDMTPIGLKFSVLKTADDTAGQSLDMEWELLPSCSGTPVHIHPHAAESYRVLAGELEVQLNGQWQTLKAGDTLTVPPGTPHTFRNPLNTIARIYNIHQPAQQFESYFTGLCRVVNLLTDNGRKPLKQDLTTGMYMSMLVRQHPTEMVLVSPPAAVVWLLSLVGRLRGLRLP